MESNCGLVNIFDSLRLPYNWKTPFGYLITLAAESASTHSALFCTSPIVSFFGGWAWLAICSLKDISNDLPELIVGKGTHGRRKEMKKRFCSIILFYSDAKQLSEALKSPIHFINELDLICSHRFLAEFSKINEFIISSVFLFMIFTLSCSLMVLL